MKLVNTDVEFMHDGKEINAFIRTHIYNGETKGHSLHFRYKDISVAVSYDDETSYWVVGQTNCKMIDKLGVEGFKTYRKYQDAMDSLEKNNIVITDKVYNFFHKTVSGNGYSIHMVAINMTDGTSLNGDAPPFFYEEARKSKTKSLDYLRSRVLEHYNKTGAVPEPRYLKSEETAQYQSMKRWLEEHAK